MILELELGAGTQPQFRERQPGKFDPLGNPDYAGRTIGGDQVFAFQIFRALGAFDAQRNAMFILAGTGCADTETDIDIIHLRQLSDDDPRQFVLFTLDSVRVPSVVLQHTEIPVCDHAFARIPVLPFRADDALFQQLVDNAKIIEHVESWRMKCRCPEIFRQRRGGLDQGDGDSPLGKIQGCGTTNGARPGN